MWTIIRKEIQVMLKEKGTFFWLFLLPIIFILIFGTIFNNTNENIKVHYINDDRSKASDMFLTNIKNIKGIELINDAEFSKEVQIKKIKDGKLSALLVIPKGFGKDLAQVNSQARLDFYRDATADAAVQPIMAVLQNIATGYREGKIVAALTATGKSPKEIQSTLKTPIAVNDVKENAKKINMINQIVPGYTVMFVFFILINMSRSVIKEKESGMIARLRSTPMKSLDYLVGVWVSGILVVIIQVATLLSFGHFAYKLSLGDFSALSLIVLSLAICATGLGLALSLFVKSENQGVAFTQIITMGGAALGGLFLPYDLMPVTMQTIGKFTPQYWAQKGFQDVMIRGAHLTNVWMSIVVLLAIGALGLIIALLRYKKFMLEAAN